ncbi:hypothetical protein [Pseudorhizobium pelagicum]|uniref:hypothetical protein n=1 Tax=Pseudorhizobium pelagicum TaxID=1509405 RepID=UPI000B26479F|nr:hypothetical protein [Pseudorhizobium pelagicum]
MLNNILPTLIIGTGLVLAASLSNTPAHSEDAKAERINVRGSILSYSGSTLKVKRREGETLDVALADDWKVSSVAAAEWVCFQTSSAFSGSSRWSSETQSTVPKTQSRLGF